ncbi:ATP-dependent DNA helicase RecG [Candidatus Woesebacteria bacterium]|nr:ATP-dependent DNA helicase RecG [Candidatus Woesebacteria bacterium]
MALTLQDSVTLLPGVGPARATQLELLGIHTLQDLLFHIPFRYEPVEPLTPIKSVVVDQKTCIYGQVISKTPVKLKFKRMIKVKVADDSGTMELTWFHMDYVLSALQVGESYYFRGKVGWFNARPTITNPIFQSTAPPFGSVLPVYHESASINSKYLGKLIHTVLSEVTIEESAQQLAFAQRVGLPDLPSAYTALHVPTTLPIDQTETAIKAGKRRLALDEMYTLIVELLKQKAEQAKTKTPFRATVSATALQTFSSFLPYALTPTQADALHAIAADFDRSFPMYRLLQGEVGSGKTTVAAFALWVAATNGQQSALVCPTNILASQHFSTLQKLFASASPSISIGLYTGKEKNTEAQILVGTHALFHAAGNTLHPTVVVVDEEHRFGVAQREVFFSKSNKPHYLSMTATPIPRTVALTALSDRDVSFIVPHKSNSNIKTWAVPAAKRKSSYQWIAKTLKETSGQALIVCPFISESSVDTLSTVKSATKEFETLQELFPDLRLRLLHGRKSAEEKDEIFAQFMDGKADILVTTPVVEVGVDLPKANIILIEGAERFGLAQLHQLRGRVGRRGQDAYCLLFTSPPAPSEDSLFALDAENQEEAMQKRLAFFASTYDGNGLAEYDLRNRGSGELLGMAQHGFGSLRFASWFDTEMISWCKEEAQSQLAKKS